VRWWGTGRGDDRRPRTRRPAVRLRPGGPGVHRAVGAPVQPKQAWTDVARLAEVGVPALNYGPGLTAQAHQAGEHVPRANLHEAASALRRYLGGSSD
jgi:succinyl-diaminopimelate desuccinylase